jgi:teichoic acid transport system permease protein
MLKAIKYVFKEHKDNIYRIRTISKENVKRETVGTTLGLGWIVFKDVIYFGIFIFFRFLLAGDKQIEGMHFLIYLITGLAPWFFFNNVISSGSAVILRSKAIISSMVFPTTILPTIEVLTIFLTRIVTFFIPFIVIGIFGDIARFNILLFIYYVFAMVMIMLSFNMLISALIAVSRDFDHFYSAFTRLAFFTIPILWNFGELVEYPQIILLVKINPLIYVVTGFRDAFVKNNPIDLNYSIYFWSIVLLLWFFGSFVQFKLRRYYSDFI